MLASKFCFFVRLLPCLVAMLTLNSFKQTQPNQSKVTQNKTKTANPSKRGLALWFFKTSYEYEPMEVHLEREGEVIMEVCQILLYSSEIGRFRDISYFNLYIAHYTGFQCKTKL